jgi:hypothetical protein
MPVEPFSWTLLAAKAAVSAVASTTVKGAYEGVKGKISGVLSEGGPLAKPLETAYREAFEGFQESLAASFVIDADARASLQALGQAPDWVATLAQLPYVPFRQIETKRAWATTTGGCAVRRWSISVEWEVRIWRLAKLSWRSWTTKALLC